MYPTFSCVLVTCSFSSYLQQCREETGEPMNHLPSLTGTVAVVTGASRGIGAGIATVLGKQGATVYVTGRSRKGDAASHSGTIDEVATSITDSGGRGIAAECDHANDTSVAAVFERVKQEQGKLDLLVNNATALGPDPFAPPPFWTKSLAITEQFQVGLRSAFIASYYAAPLLIKASRSLVVNVSYYGSVSYHLDPAYGATKAGLDKLTHDMAQDFRPFGVAVVSIWPGPTATERAKTIVAKLPGGEEILASQETPQFSGLAVACLYGDPDLMSKSGTVVIAAEAALEYGYTDSNGKQPSSLRSTKGSPPVYFPR
jgi:NAD(P)-dependent dehydrogenase (short-subunit alcohol dehydrogenase family)